MFTANSAGSQGGALYNDNYDVCSPVLTNCTFVENGAPFGNALLSDSIGQTDPSMIEIRNCIFWNGGDEIINNDASTITVTYSDVWQTSGIYPGTGNINEEPLFGSDLHLRVGSPCRNAGDPVSAPLTFPADDIDGESRPVGIRYDMGADKFFDSDSDDIPDYWEYKWFGPGDLSHHAGSHSDSDGLTDLEEFENGTDPFNPDSDGDGWSDSNELAAGSDPLNPDDVPASIPTLREWGIMVFGLLLITVGAVVMRRKKGRMTEVR